MSKPTLTRPDSAWRLSRIWEADGLWHPVRVPGSQQDFDGLNDVYDPPRKPGRDVTRPAARTPTTAGSRG